MKYRICEFMASVVASFAMIAFVAGCIAANVWITFVAEAVLGLAMIVLSIIDETIELQDEKEEMTKRAKYKKQR